MKTEKIPKVECLWILHYLNSSSQIHWKHEPTFTAFQLWKYFLGGGQWGKPLNNFWLYWKHWSSAERKDGSPCLVRVVCVCSSSRIWKALWLCRRSECSPDVLSTGHAVLRLWINSSGRGHPPEDSGVEEFFHSFPPVLLRPWLFTHLRGLTADCFMRKWDTHKELCINNEMKVEDRGPLKTHSEVFVVAEDPWDRRPKPGIWSCSKSVE